MPTLKPFIFLFVVAFGITACAVGRDFVRPEHSSLTPGKTTSAEVMRRFGPPSQRGTTIENGKTLDTIGYAYASGRGKPHYPSVTPARGIDFWLQGDVVVGHTFQSSFDSDHTNFNERGLSQIEEGVSTLNDVTALFGEPDGIFIYPLVERVGDRGLVYSYSQYAGSAFSPRIYVKRLVLTLDPSDTVTKVEFVQSGER